MARNRAALIDALETRYAAIFTELAALDATKAGGLPNAQQSGAVDHVGYKDGLYRELAAIRAELAALDGSFEVISEVDA